MRRLRALPAPLTPQCPMMQILPPSTSSSVSSFFWILLGIVLLRRTEKPHLFRMAPGVHGGGAWRRLFVENVSTVHFFISNCQSSLHRTTWHRDFENCQSRI
jgi:hypothetical protein